jgi:hypothetical protein
MPILKNRALAVSCPQGIRSIRKPIFSSYDKLDSLTFTVVDDLGLIGGAIGSESADPLSLGHLPDTVPDKGKVSGSRSDSTLSGFISYHETVFREMADDRHIA